MKLVLGRLDTWLIANRPEFHASLRSGADAKTVADLEKKLGKSIGADVLALLEWHDGSPVGEDFIWNFRFLSAKEIASNVVTMRAHSKAGEFDDKIDWWVDGWIPLLDNGAGDYICVDTIGSFGGALGQVIEFRHDDDRRNVLAPSLEAWLTAIASACEANLLDESEPRDDDAFDTHLKAALPGFPKQAAARKNDAKLKARISTRDAIKNAIDTLEGPKPNLAKRVELEKIVKAARACVADEAQVLVKRRDTAKAELFEIFPEPRAKKIAYAVWSTSTVGENWKDGYVVGVDLKGDVVFKDKKVKA